MTTRRLLLINAIPVALIALALTVGTGSRDPGAFWRAASLTAVQAEHYSSLGDMTRAADAVVVGRLASVSPGRVFTDPDDFKNHYASARVVVDEVLAGSLPKDWVLEIPVPNEAKTGFIEEEISPNQAILFLRSKEQEARSLGLGAERAAEEAGYYRLVTFEAVINEHHGEAEPVRTTEEPFLDFGSRTFSAVLDEIRGSR